MVCNAYDLAATSRGALGLVDEALEALSLGGQRFSEDLAWLRDRRESWADRNWRVALIGVTSSGKSALLNAMMGAGRLLPVRVAPSSSHHVLCRKGETLQVVVHFTDGARKTFRENLPSVLHAYGSEAGNPENHRGVEGIEVVSPRALLASDVALIDTPGLDAYALGRHEELTMKHVLPTVDMVLYLTTTKGDADHQNLEAIGRVADEDKPLVLVQNKIDAVQPKLGDRGRVVKTRAVVVEEVRRKAEKLLGRSPHACVREAPICQVSAVWALSEDEALRKASGMTELSGTIDDAVERLAPALWRRRLVQLERHLAETVAAEREILRGRPGADALASSRKALEAAQSAFEAGKAKRATALQHAKASRTRLGQDANACIDRVRRLGKHDTGAASQAVAEMSRLVDRTYDELAGLMDASRAALEGMAKAANLRPEDYTLRPMEKSPLRSRARVGTRSETRTDWVKKSGFGHKISRFFGGLFGTHWGMQPYSHSVSVLDVAGTVRAMEAEREEAMDMFRTLTGVVRREGDTQESCIEAELVRRREDLERKRREKMDDDTRRTLVGKLDAVLSNVNHAVARLSLAPTPSPRPRVVSLPPEPVSEVSPLTGALMSLAHAMTRSQREGLVEAAFGDVRRACNGSTPGSLLVWGWDGDEIERFASLFLGKWVRSVEGLGGDPLQRVAGMRGDVTVVNESLIEGERWNAVLRKLASKPRVTFALLDAGQPGATASRLARSRLQGLVRNGSPLVCVAQSVEELEKSGCVGEGLFELRQAVEGQRLPVRGALANHPSPIYSHVTRQLFLNFEELGRPRAVERLHAELEAVPGARSVPFTQWLQDWSRESSRARS